MPSLSKVRFPLADRLSPSEFRVFAAVLILRHRQEKVTVRSIANLIGWEGASHAWITLRALRQKGLLTFEDAKDGTVRPLRRLEIWCNTEDR